MSCMGNHDRLSLVKPPARDAQVNVGVGGVSTQVLAAVTVAQAVSILRLVSQIQLSETRKGNLKCNSSSLAI